MVDFISTYQTIQRDLESQYGLLIELLANGCLTSKIKTVIQSITNPIERNAKLIDCIDKTNFKLFLDGLKKSHQGHIANYIERSGVRSGVEFGDWPLNDEQVKYLNTNYKIFIRDIHPSIVDDLISKGCISENHKHSIESKPTAHGKIGELLEIVGRRSMKDFDIFLECLQKDHSYLIGDVKDKKGTIHSFLTKGGTFIEEISSDCSESVMGLGVVNDELFVVRECQSKVNVYDSHSLTSSRDISIPGMALPRGLAGCAQNKALYISDEKFMCIHRVDLTNNSVTRWTTREDYVPRGLSMTAMHNLVSVWTRGTGGGDRVVEYASDGQLVREIGLHRSIEYTWQTVLLSNDQFIVCNGSSNSPLHRVCQINAEGQTIKSYGREKGEGEGRLNGPISLSIDNNSKHVFVADINNDRVLLLDSELTYLGQVHTPSDLKWPTGLCFDTSTDRLYVSEYSGRVIVISPTVR